MSKYNAKIREEELKRLVAARILKMLLDERLDRPCCAK